MSDPHPSPYASRTPVHVQELDGFGTVRIRSSPSTPPRTPPCCTAGSARNAPPSGA